jgi:hypothetical protein
VYFGIVDDQSASFSFFPRNINFKKQAIISEGRVAYHSNPLIFLLVPNALPFFHNHPNFQIGKCQKANAFMISYTANFVTQRNHAQAPSCPSSTVLPYAPHFSIKKGLLQFRLRSRQGNLQTALKKFIVMLAEVFAGDAPEDFVRHH